MKQILLAMAVVLAGCGNAELSRLKAENERLKAEIDSKKLKTQLEEENKILKDEAARLDAVGTYEVKDENGVHQMHLLEDGGFAEEDRKPEEGTKWDVVNGEIHLGIDPSSDRYKKYVDEKSEEPVLMIFRINRDKSITSIAEVTSSGERKDILGKGASGSIKAMTLVKVK